MRSLRQAYEAEKACNVTIPFYSPNKNYARTVYIVIANRSELNSRTEGQKDPLRENSQRNGKHRNERCGKFQGA
eukprot:6466577-Amphidinium_carterae.1